MSVSTALRQMGPMSCLLAAGRCPALVTRREALPFWNGPRESQFISTTRFDISSWRHSFRQVIVLSAKKLSACLALGLRKQNPLNLTDITDKWASGFETLGHSAELVTERPRALSELVVSE